MCYQPTDLPPNPPSTPTHGQPTGYDLELIASDGNHFLAYFAHPALQPATPDPRRANVLIYPDVRGLHNFYKQLALRFAEQGIHALAIDYFGRTAGLHTPRDNSFDFMPHVQKIEYPTFLLDVRAALAYLQDHAPSPSTQNSKLITHNSSTIFTLGFCMGGSLSLLTAAEDLPLVGAIAFYSGFSRRFPGLDTPTLDRATAIRVPVLGLYGGDDQGIPPELIHQLDQNLDTAGVPHDLHIYPGAPHSFFDRKATDHAQASADAWTRVLSFISTYTQRD